MRLFLDRCVSSHIGEALRLLNCQFDEILIHDELFEQDADDTDWLPKLASLDEPDSPIVILSGDFRISHVTEERAAWRESGLTAFFLVGGWAEKHLANQARDVLHFLPEIRRKAKQSPKGSGFQLNPKGKGSCSPIYDPLGR